MVAGVRRSGRGWWVSVLPATAAAITKSVLGYIRLDLDALRTISKPDVRAATTPAKDRAEENSTKRKTPWAFQS
ncbi:unnamed protein product [Nezara viridula]|uniref:Uncharacterized protein n=1 Tax=Nezara viridula TaxID=85310 RepID=A0A9P0HTW1_NEZVI|nr:unnamed protein product [Nezara viridula]